MPRPSSRVPWSRIAVFSALLMLFQGCGKKDRMPPYSQVPPITMGESAQALPVTVRVLLMEGFESIEIRGSERSERVSVRVSEQGLELFSDEGGKDQTLGMGSGFRFKPGEGRILQIDGRSYRNVIDVFINPVGKPVAVNELEIEQYLKSVIPNELGPRKFPQLEALKAQAVAARTFAIKNLGQNARFGYDLYGDQRSQVYAGVASEQPLSDRAVKETESLVATFQGELIWAMYSSTCGGETEAFDQIFDGGPIEYLKGGVICHDEESPYHTWEERIVISELQSKLDRYVDVGRLQKLVPLKRSAAGRVVEMRFVGSEGEETLRGNDLRFALGLKSNFITAMKPFLDSSGNLTEMEVRGRGWGHGVGMCQMGAVALAKKGASHQEILKQYYRGINLNSYQR